MAEFLFSAAELFGQSGRIIWKRAGNTGRRANKCQQMFLQAYFEGNQTNALASISILIHGIDYHRLVTV